MSFGGGWLVACMQGKGGLSTIVDHQRLAQNEGMPGKACGGGVCSLSGLIENWVTCLSSTIVDDVPLLALNHQQF
jgi:hypothetical protein